jgi:hypothetical protein
MAYFITFSLILAGSVYTMALFHITLYFSWSLRNANNFAGLYRLSFQPFFRCTGRVLATSAEYK